ncbi:MAG TPA: hypothetical protein VN282_02265 [Pyrinomonadaceae bacterium]|nr:hypothetical protein [Pyrinomonadaceae bacterium]
MAKKAKSAGVLQLAAAVFNTLRQLKTGGIRVSLRQAKISRRSFLRTAAASRRRPFRDARHFTRPKIFEDNEESIYEHSTDTGDDGEPAAH